MDRKDIFIVGGGINGTAIAADAAGRGLSVLLCEKSDIASATSSASTKLIHGGLRYLEMYDFKLVKEALHEREILMHKASHLITPLQFILPHEKHLRPAWLIRLGLFLYDHLSAKKLLPNSTYIHFKKTNYGEPLLNQFSKGFSYYDCFTDDSRLTILNALAAKEKGATILNYHEFISAQPENNQWKIRYKNMFTHDIQQCYANILINTSGPWVNQTQKIIHPQTNLSIKLVKGSHIIIPKLYTGDFAYILQNSDKRIVFAIPYQDDFTLIGTTDISFEEDLDHQITISPEEINYLCQLINNYFKKSITPNDVIASYAGVRCLQSEKTNKLSKMSRDHKIIVDIDNHPPLITIIGGKLTTHRSLAEETVNLLKPFFPAMKPAWTASSYLPGGDFPENDFKKFLTEFKNNFPWLPEEIRHRYAKNYGTRAYLILADSKTLNDLGEDFTNGIYEKELIYLIQHEWAKSIDDILWRRTKCGLILDGQAKNKISLWLAKFYATA